MHLITRFIFTACLFSIAHLEVTWAGSRTSRFVSDSPKRLTADSCQRYAENYRKTQFLLKTETPILIDFTQPEKKLYSSIVLNPKSELLLAIYFVNNYPGMNEIFSLLFMTDPIRFVTTYDQITPKGQASCEIIYLPQGNTSTIGNNWFNLSILKSDVEREEDVEFLSTKTIYLKESTK